MLREEKAWVSVLRMDKYTSYPMDVIWTTGWTAALQGTWETANTLSYIIQ
jgi:hypothetical protein